MPIQILDHIQLFINQYKKYWQMSYLRTLRDVTFEKSKMKTIFLMKRNIYHIKSWSALHKLLQSFNLLYFLQIFSSFDFGDDSCPKTFISLHKGDLLYYTINIQIRHLIWYEKLLPEKLNIWNFQVIVYNTNVFVLVLVSSHSNYTNSFNNMETYSFDEVKVQKPKSLLCQ